MTDNSSEPEDDRGLVARLDAITSLTTADDLAALEGVVRSLDQVKPTASLMEALYRLLERFPYVESFGMFWSVLHALERSPHHAGALLDSVCRSPGEFTILMVNRLLNGGVTHVDGVDLMQVLAEIARGQYSEQARTDAQRYLDHQTSARGH